MADKHEWTADWPTHTGWYWFWGWRSAFSKEHKHGVELRAAHVYVDSMNQPTVICDGQFLYKEEGAEGMFCQMEMPPMMPYLEGERDANAKTG